MKTVELLALDVDGTLTDGAIYLSGDGREMKRYDVKDGTALVTFRKRGGVVAFISGRTSASTVARAAELEVQHLYNGTKDKLGDLMALAQSLGFSPDQVVYVGDDVNDIECLRWAGMGVVVADGVDEAKAAADWVTRCPGGRGALREVVDRLIAEGLR
ncbi:MAG: HAD family hydrolase [Dethiosulfovibrio peptidovorans]|nr:MAG: HAD family hydrolase [Dethiosulfovibrio peptidovorans]